MKPKVALSVVISVASIIDETSDNNNVSNIVVVSHPSGDILPFVLSPKAGKAGIRGMPQYLLLV